MLPSDFARAAHANQTRKYSGEPYFTHVERVAKLVAEHGGTPDQIAAAYLHDTLEDCETVTYQQLADEFGSHVADLVLTLTNDEKKKEAVGKVPYMIAKLSVMSPEALLIKLCDTLNNITETPSPSQANNYRIIITALTSVPHPNWTPTHHLLAAKILTTYHTNFPEN